MLQYRFSEVVGECDGVKNVYRSIRLQVRVWVPTRFIGCRVKCVCQEYRVENVYDEVSVEVWRAVAVAILMLVTILNQ